MIETRNRPGWIVAALLGVLGGCSSPRYYVDIPEPTAQVPAQAAMAGDEWVVKAGDTLYSIAFTVGLDWRDIAAGNAVEAPYTIYPGQRLRLARGALARAPEPDPVESPAPSAPAAGSQSGTTLASPSSIPIPGPGPGQGSAVAAPVVTPTQPVAQTPQAQAPPAPIVMAPATQPSPEPARPSNRVIRNGAWQWPADGKLLRGFSGGAPPHKGVDLAGAMGDPVYAVNGGSVVYAGNGVRGYGNLIIVKHDAQYLSAYAHNRRLLVKEGDVVSGGQQIAEIGDSGADRVKLHFELRRQGNPVDPLKVLPKR